MKHETPVLTKLGRIEDLTFGGTWGLIGDDTPEGWRLRPWPK